MFLLNYWVGFFSYLSNYWDWLWNQLKLQNYFKFLQIELNQKKLLELFVELLELLVLILVIPEHFSHFPQLVQQYVLREEPQQFSNEVAVLGSISIQVLSSIQPHNVRMYSLLYKDRHNQFTVAPHLVSSMQMLLPHS
ncbi:unnamed protein product [Paramecium sonneborni]|uniref:Uncharacterized protein n=1 Tax=Paramecium sonneborni TaxID=65129 RepID=A0A8S1L4J9_9CILI|nr:unnamed protein product [Paramecium sonneborni]